MMTPEEKNKIGSKFFNDPDWIIVENMILEYLEPFKEISGIDSKQSNDIIATEVRGRQLMVKQLTEFLRSCRILRTSGENKGISFK